MAEAKQKKRRGRPPRSPEGGKLVSRSYAISATHHEAIAAHQKQYGLPSANVALEEMVEIATVADTPAVRKFAKKNQITVTLAIAHLLELGVKAAK